MYAESNLLVVLDENATTGYSWTSAIEGSTLALYTEKSISAEEAYPAEDANRVGAEGSHLFSFKGMPPVTAPSRFRTSALGSRPTMTRRSFSR